MGRNSAARRWRRSHQRQGKRGSGDHQSPTTTTSVPKPSNSSRPTSNLVHSTAWPPELDGQRLSPPDPVASRHYPAGSGSYAPPSPLSGSASRGPPIDHQDVAADSSRSNPLRRRPATPPPHPEPICRIHLLPQRQPDHHAPRGEPRCRLFLVSLVSCARD
jgi:hypothetical protein